MTELNRHLAANLKALRQRWGYSQAELAERSEVSVGYVGDLEVGGKWPSAEVLDRLATALHVPAFQLFLDPAQATDFRDWQERRDMVNEWGDKLLTYLKTTGRDL